MLASMSEWVRKMTTRSLMRATQRHRVAVDPTRCAAADLQQDHRHVVVLRRVADERRDLAQHALAQLLGRQVRVLLDEPPEPRLAEAVVARRSSPR